MFMRNVGIAVLGILLGSLFSSLVTFAWTGPTGAPPSSNVPVPLNVGTTNQVKNAGLSLNSLVIFGNTLLSGLGTGVGSYLNFDYTAGGTSGSGSTGYGIRDNAGTLEFKNLGGSWQSFASIIAAYFASGATNIVGQIKFSDGTTQTTAASASKSFGSLQTCSVGTTYTAASDLVAMGVCGTGGSAWFAGEINGVQVLFTVPNGETNSLTLPVPKGAVWSFSILSGSCPNLKTCYFLPTQ